MTQDIRPEWLNVARRLQAAASQQQGAAVISVRIVVSGISPVCWTEPEVIKLEPKAKGAEIIKLILN